MLAPGFANRTEKSRAVSMVTAGRGWRMAQSYLRSAAIRTIFDAVRAQCAAGRGRESARSGPGGRLHPAQHKSGRVAGLNGLRRAGLSELCDRPRRSRPDAGESGRLEENGRVSAGAAVL